MTVKYGFPARGSDPPLTLAVRRRGPAAALDPGKMSDRAELFIGDEGMLYSDGRGGPRCAGTKFKDFPRPPETLPSSPGHTSSGSRPAGEGPAPGLSFLYSDWVTESNDLATSPMGPARNSRGSANLRGEPCRSRRIHPASVPRRLGRYSELSVRQTLPKTRVELAASRYFRAGTRAVLVLVAAGVVALRPVVSFLRIGEHAEPFGSIGRMLSELRRNLSKTGTTPLFLRPRDRYVFIIFLIDIRSGSRGRRRRKGDGTDPSPRHKHHSPTRIRKS